MRVNGQPGLMVVVQDEVVNLLTFDVVDGRIATCFAVRNPDKLARVGQRLRAEKTILGE